MLLLMKIKFKILLLTGVIFQLNSIIRQHFQKLDKLQTKMMSVVRSLWEEIVPNNRKVFNIRQTF